MNRAERVAALEALLARVQANVAARGPAPLARAHGADRTPPDTLAASGDRADGIHAPRRDAVLARPPRPLEPEDLGEWSSLLERELRDPSPVAEPGAAADPTPAPVQVTTPAPVPVTTPVPVPVPVPVPAPVPVPVPVPVPTAAPDVDDGPGPGSELARAIHEVTVGRPAVEPAALWSEAAAELRGRRGGDAPAVKTSAAAREAEVPVVVASARRSARRAARSRSAPRATAATRVATVVLGLSVVTLAAVLTWRLVGPSSSSSPFGSPTASAFTSSPRGQAASATRPAPSATPPASAPAAIVAKPPPAPSTIAAPAPAADPSAPPPAVRRPVDHGLLRIDGGEVVDVYLQGVRVGETGRWLEVPCGVRNARLARRGSPPPGHSFPMWMGSGRTVHVPCGAAHAVTWTWE